MLAEYSNATWAGLPRAWGRGRDGKDVRLSVVHYTAGSEHRLSAENGAAYDKIRTDGTSCHVFHDSDSSLQEVLRGDRANAAYHKGNRLGIQHELCGTAQTRAQWLDEASDAILWRAARAVARDCVDFNLEPRRLSVPEVRAAWYEFPNGPRGICGHADITLAFPEDGGNHTDPGRDFPWDIFLARVRQSMGGEIDMAVNDVQKADAVFNNRPTARLDTNADGNPDTEFPNLTFEAIEEIRELVARPVQLDYELLAEALIRKAAEKA